MELRAAGKRAPAARVCDRGDLRAVRRWILAQRLDAVLSASPLIAGSPDGADWPFERPLGWASLNLDPEVPCAGEIADHERIGALAIEQVISRSRWHARGPASSAMVTYVPVRWRPAASLAAG